jgi:hypothetical protein
MVTLFLVTLIVQDRQADPFYLGAWVGADPHKWGDLKGMGEDSDSTIHAVCKDLADLGCNAVWVSGFSPHFAEKPMIGKWLDAARKHGLRAVIQGSGFPYSIPKGEEGVLERTRKEVVPFWEEVAREWGKHPALLAYCPVEEIGDNVEQGETATVDALAEVGRAVARIDPDHPVVTIHIAAWINVARAEARIRGKELRALVADLYVFTEVHDWSDPNASWKSPEEATSGFLKWTGEHAELARSRGIPLWMFGQANETTWVRKIEGKLQSRRNFKMPKEAEMRFQVWASILSGAKALFFFPYTSTPQPPEESRRALDEWEYGTGMRTLDGKTTPSHAGLAKVGPRLKEDLALLGRIVPDGAPAEADRILARRFKDPRDGSGHVLVLNRDLSRPARIPRSLQDQLKIKLENALEPGDGVRITPGP